MLRFLPYFFALSLPLILVMSALATQSLDPPQTLWQKLHNVLLSGEVLVAISTGIVGYCYSLYSQKRQKELEQRQELGRLKQQEELHNITTSAISSGITEIKGTIDPVLKSLTEDVSDIKQRLSDVDKNADEALRISKQVESYQEVWLNNADVIIRAILKSNNPKLIHRLFGDRRKD